MGAGFEARKKKKGKKEKFPGDLSWGASPDRDELSSRRWMTLHGVKGRNDRKSGASTRGVSESCWFCCRPHRRIVSESDRGSALSGPDELEIPRPCGIHVPSVAYQVEARLVLQLAVIRLTLDKGRVCTGPFRGPPPGIPRVIMDTAIGTGRGVQNPETKTVLRCLAEDKLRPVSVV